MLIEKKSFRSPVFDVRKITLIGMLSAISIVLGITKLGFIPIPPVMATIMHVPVIIGAMIGGPIVGVMIGLIFGIFSIIEATQSGLPTAFIFINPLVSVLPRVLIGLTTYYTYSFLSSKAKASGKEGSGLIKSIIIGCSAFIGSITNTIGVLGAMYVFYLEGYAKALNISVDIAGIGIWSTALLNGLPEAIISILICIPVIHAVQKIRK